MVSKIIYLSIHLVAAILVLVGAFIGYLIFIPIGIAIEAVFWIWLIERRRSQKQRITN